MANPGDEALAYPKLPAAVALVLGTLIEAGHEVALVGGCVRDSVLAGREHLGDWDAATSADPDEVARLFPGATWESRFGTVTLAGPPQIEITPYRTEGSYGDRRRPDTVLFGASLTEDLARRDFTINAVAWVPDSPDAGTGRVVDPYGGRTDLADRLLRTVGEPRERFGEDALRLIRAARFAGRFDMRLDPATEAAIGELAPTVATVSPERVRDELQRILRDDVPSRALVLLERLGLLAILLPELAALRGVPQTKLVPGDALDHTLAAVDAAPNPGPSGDASVRMAALLHDIGKADTLADGHFIGHDRAGAAHARRLLRRLRMPGWESAAIVHAVRHHMYDYHSGWTDAAVRRFVRRLEPHGTELLFALRRADNAGSGIGSEGDANQAELERRIAVEVERQPDLLLGNRLVIDGHDLQAELGLAPGPRIGVLLDRLMERVLDEPGLNERATLLRLAREIDDELR